MGLVYDVAIIGGGVIGGSIAFQLAKRGKKVIVLEKGRLAEQASGAAAGMLAAQGELEKETGPLFKLAVQSRAMFPHLAEELRELSGIDISLINRGMLKIATSQEQVHELKEVMTCQLQAGQEAEWLTGEQVRAREPGLSEVILGAMYIPNDGQVLAPELSLAFLKSAAVLGAELREYTEVKSLLVERGEVKGVVTHGETIRSEQVVVATGAWSGSWLGQGNEPATVYPVKGECLSVLTTRPLLRTTVFSHGCYLVPKRGGRLVIGATMKEHTYDRKVSIEGISTLMERAKRLLPAIAEAEFEKAWAGTRPQTRDGLPILGEHPEWKGVYLAAGHYRNGILLSPVTGVVIADLMEGKDVGGIKPFQAARGLTV
ncbi:glycine oxidase ThiO [Ammoniphilus sp. CFH 90114]|uniref:glycine oxidase ThiO n=1 Tax=Ammoniphilus sp. CFH 90114 TaxID=2493665 RepID=UPI00100FA477|nr:glycine oxidase ThiO [Ammoniphilus sp. CFH 90114]RXT05683.1 glycine oxidase ThiO [Ammoniphilus sp. CFH 90114]